MDALNQAAHEVRPSETVVITIPFRPLLKTIAKYLQLNSPVYTLLDASQNTTSVMLQGQFNDIELTYFGGPAKSTEESNETAALRAVRDIIQKFRVIVEDFTYHETRKDERCSQLYRLKRNELEQIAQQVALTELEESIPISPKGSIHIYLDYMSILRKIFKTITIRCTKLQTVEHYPGSYSSWITIAAPYGTQKQKNLIGPRCTTQDLAKDYLAKEAINYLILAYNLQIIDANYGSATSKSSKVVLDLERGNYSTVQAMVFGMQEDEELSSLLVEEDSLTIEGAIAYPPPITLTGNTARSPDILSLESAEANNLSSADSQSLVTTPNPEKFAFPTNQQKTPLQEIAAAPTRFSILFGPLLEKIAMFLCLPQPERAILEQPQHKVAITVRSMCGSVDGIYIGGPSASVEESFEEASRLAVSDLKDKYDIYVRDITAMRGQISERCTNLWRLKHQELQRLATGLPKLAELEEFPFPEANHLHVVSIDFVQALHILNTKIPIAFSDMEVVEHTPTTFTAWMSITHHKSPYGCTSIFSDTTWTPAAAEQDLAAKVINYLAPIYNIEVIDVNYAPVKADINTDICKRIEGKCIVLKGRAPLPPGKSHAGITVSAAASPLTPAKTSVRPKRPNKMGATQTTSYKNSASGSAGPSKGLAFK